MPTHLQLCGISLKSSKICLKSVMCVYKNFNISNKWTLFFSLGQVFQNSNQHKNKVRILTSLEFVELDYDVQDVIAKRLLEVYLFMIIWTEI